MHDTLQTAHMGYSTNCTCRILCKLYTHDTLLTAHDTLWTAHTGYSQSAHTGYSTNCTWYSVNCTLRLLSKCTWYSVNCTHRLLSKCTHRILYRLHIIHWTAHTGYPASCTHRLLYKLHTQVTLQTAHTGYSASTFICNVCHLSSHVKLLHTRSSHPPSLPDSHNVYISVLFSFLGFMWNNLICCFVIEKTNFRQKCALHFVMSYKKAKSIINLYLCVLTWGSMTYVFCSVMMMMAHSLQTRIVGKVDGQFLHADWLL